MLVFQKGKVMVQCSCGKNSPKFSTSTFEDEENFNKFVDKHKSHVKGKINR